MTENQMCAEWLKKRGYHIVWVENELYLRKKHVTSYPTQDVQAKDMELWTRETAGMTQRYQVQLFYVQGKNRRPLRSLIREWMIGL